MITGQYVAQEGIILRYGTRTSLTPSELLDMAKEFFTDEKLKVTDENDRRVCLENDLGFITIQLRGQNGEEVDIITEGFDARVKNFLKQLK